MDAFTEAWLEEPMVQAVACHKSPGNTTLPFSKSWRHVPRIQALRLPGAASAKFYSLRCEFQRRLERNGRQTEVIVGGVSIPVSRATWEELIESLRAARRGNEARDSNIRRLISKGATQDKAIEQIDTTDKARAAFVRQYLGLKWPEPHLYHVMFNTEMGESCTATMLVGCVQQFDRDAE